MKKEDKNTESKYSNIQIDYIKALNHQKINIQGIDIYFPYKPYEPQNLYMKKIISTLNNKGNISALESQTGTGKTLYLLCAVLAWLKHKNKSISIYYCTRTVSQINNLLKELNKICYCPNVSFLSSRKFTCLKYSKKEKDKMDNNKLNDICETLRRITFKGEGVLNIYDIKGNQIYPICLYCKNELFYDSIDNFKLEDIEYLLKGGKEKNFCPYYYNIKKN